MTSKIKGLIQRNCRHSQKHYAKRLTCERLEDRLLLSIDLHGVPEWQEQGPGPITGGQVEGLGVQNNPVAGGIEAIAAHPFDANILYVGTVNGGIWKTASANFPNDGVDNDGDGNADEGDENPIWTPLTDQLPSLAIGAIAFSPLDNSTLFAGTGDFRSGSTVLRGGGGDGAIGVLKTVDRGDTWDIVGPELAGFRIRSIIPTSIGAPNTQVVLVAAVDGGGIFRSADGGVSFTQISGTSGADDGVDNDGDGATDEAGELGADDGIDNDVDGVTDEAGERNLPNGSASHLVADPGNPNRFYAAIPGAGVYRSDNGGIAWQQINIGLGNATVNAATATRIELAVSPVGPNPVYAALISAVPGPALGLQLNGMFRSVDLGANWTALDIPQTNEAGTLVGLQPSSKPGGQGGIHFSMLADSNNANVLFVGGDRQPGGFPNSIGCEDFSGRHFRGNASLPAGTQFAAINCDNAGGTSPHADSRDMVFDARSNIVESDDGGIYRLVNPNLTNRRWVSLNGNIRVTEFYSVAYDPVNHAVIGGAQDVGVSEQNAPDNFTWRAQTTADGGFVAVATDLPGQDALRFFSKQNFGGFSRAAFDDENHETDQVQVELNVVGTGNSLFGVEYATGGCSPPTGTFQFIQPYVLNAVFSDQMLIGTNFLYEAIGRGDQVTALGGVQSLNNDATDNDCDGTVDEDDEFGPLNPIGQVTAMVYGGRRDGEDNGDVIYVGTKGGSIDGGVTNGTLFLRTTNNTDSLADFVTLTNYGAAGGTTPLDIAVDPHDWQRGYLIDALNRVWRFVNAGNLASDWTDITSNLTNLSTNLRTIEVFPNTAAADDEVVLVGGDGGVFRTLNPNAGQSTLWTEFGANLPNAVATDLHYVRHFDPASPNDPRDDVLLVGTLGRGAWTISDASDEITAPGDLVIDGFNLTIFDDTFRLILNEHNPLMLDVFVNNDTPNPTLSLPLAALQTIHVNGFAGNDTLIIDFANGNPIPVVGLDFAGGVGNDTVRVLGTDAEETISLDAVGPRTGVQLHDPDFIYDAVMSLEVENVEVHAAGAGDKFNVHATSGDLAMLTIDGGAGSDTYNISPDEKNLDRIDGAISIESGGGVDRLNINDQNNAGNQTYTLTDSSFDRTAFPLLDYVGIIYLTLNTSLDRDVVDVDSTAFIHTTINSGDGDDDFNLAPTTRNLENILGELIVDGGGDRDQVFVVDQDSDGNRYTIREDELRRTGWLGHVELLGINSVTLTTGNEQNTFSVEDTVYDLAINAGDDNDTFYVTPISDSLDDIQGDLTIDGGDGTNSLEFFDGADAQDDNYVIRTGDLSRSGLLWPLQFSALDSVTLHAGGGDSSFSIESSATAWTIRAGDGDDEFIVTRNGELAEIGANLTLDGEGNDDTLHLYDQSHDDPDTYTITDSTIARSSTNFMLTYAAVEEIVLDSGDGGSVFDINGTRRNTPVTINAGDGADTFNVNGPPSSELTLNGEAPFQRPGDSLAITVDGGEGSYEPGELTGSGTVTVDGQTINFNGLEPVTVNGFENFSMRTPLVTDVFTIESPTSCVTRISGTSGGVPFESLSFSDVSQFLLDTGRGDDSVNIQGTPCSSQAGDADEFRIDLGDGDDLVRMALSAIQTGFFARMITVLGGGSFTGDRLTIVPSTTGNPVNYRAGSEPGTGAIGLGTQRRAVFTGIELVERRPGGSDSPPTPSLALNPFSDSGVPGLSNSFFDRITNVSRPTFEGMAEPNSIVRVFATSASGAAVLLGETAVGPATPTSPFEAHWSLTSQIDLNDPALGFATPDGMRHITATAEDMAGNMSTAAGLDIMVDTQGPQLSAVKRSDGVNVVGQEAFGPTPLITSLDVTLFDQIIEPDDKPPGMEAVDRVAASDPKNYVLIGDRAGVVPVRSVEVISTGTSSPSGGGSGGSGRSGAVIIDGSDRDEHGARTSAGNVGGWKLIEQMVQFAYAGASNAGAGILVVGASGKALSAINSVASALGLSTTVVSGSQVPAVQFENFRMIYVSSDAQNVPGGVSDTDLSLLEQRRADIVSFVNSGGSLVALSESEAAAPYRWFGLPAQHPPIDSGSSTERLYQTPAVGPMGWSVTDADLNLGIPWHHQFGGSSGFAGLVPFVRSVGPDGIAGDADDRVVTLGLAPGSRVMNPEPAGRTTTVRLHFDRPLPDDKFSLMVSPGVTDMAGNPLGTHRDTPNMPLTEQHSGELAVHLPICPPGTHSELVQFGPTTLLVCVADSGALGSFGNTQITVTITQFAVDTAPEIGTFYQGSWYIDLNGNGIFDPGHSDEKNHDIVWKFGQVGDFPIVGDWDGDGFDEIGVYGVRDNELRFELDVNGNGAFDPVFGDVSFRPIPPNLNLPPVFSPPIAGDFNPAVPGDEIGFLHFGQWFIDFDGDRSIEPDERIITNFEGYPIVGDWLNSGRDRVGSYQDGVFRFDLNGDFQFDVIPDAPTIDFEFLGGDSELPVIGDWDADGDDNIGLFSRDRQGVVPHDEAEWYLDLGFPDFDIPGDGLFQPPPTGRPGVPSYQQDIFYRFGDVTARPVVGNFDPPPPGVQPADTSDSNPIGSIMQLDPPMLPSSSTGDDHVNRVGPKGTRLTWNELSEIVAGGVIENTRDRDVFQFTPTRNGRIAIDLTTPFSLLDPELSVYNSKRRSIDRSDNLESSPDSHVELQVVSGQTYFLMAKGTRGTSGSYELSLDYLLAGDAVSDPVSFPETQLQTSGRIGQAGDVAVYRVTASSSGRLEIRASDPLNVLDSVLDAYDNTGRILAHNDTAATNPIVSQVVLDVVTGQSYYIRLRGRGASVGQYELTLDWLLENAVNPVISGG